MFPNVQETADLVTFTEKILNGKLHFLSSVKFHYGSLITSLSTIFPKKNRYWKPNQFSMRFPDKKNIQCGIVKNLWTFYLKRLRFSRVMTLQLISHQVIYTLLHLLKFPMELCGIPFLSWNEGTHYTVVQCTEWKHCIACSL